MPGTALNETYKVRGQLGAGTFAKVYEVMHKDEQKTYACKIMAPLQSYLQHTSDGKKEAELVEKLCKLDATGEAGIVRFKECFLTKDPRRGREWFCLVMEKLDLSLFDFVRANGEAGLEIRTIQKIAQQILITTAFLHKHKLTHTDIKHKNILLMNTEHYIVTDNRNYPKQVQAKMRDGNGPRVHRFLHLKNPVVKMIDFANLTHTMDPHIHPIHVKQWRAPEVHLEDAGVWEESSDLWCIGCLFYFMYTGTLLFNTQENEYHLAMMEKAIGPIPDAMIRASKRYKGVSEQPVQRWFPGKPVPMDVLNVKPLADYIQPEHEQFLDLLKGLFTFHPGMRLTAIKALEHPFFATEFPAEVKVDENTRTGVL
eukprot:TRINITY_DN1791_c0_g1_i2.p2 TRINITY_DN1791_c0_g1~~TRINITY_DN1791_c0_g1_i2.p2  ORF type:complete len:369 (+),score=194.93 TRINITY_DN1791_c0_g1_i2:253-1359(+)